MSKNDVAPIIIKRKKAAPAEEGHGGAWKVAYADFVTAMMAFFLLMWLLNATTEKQRKGLADYFSPSIPLSKVSGGGEGAFWGDNVFAEDSLAFNGKGASEAYPSEMRRARGELGTAGEAARQSEPGAGNLTGAQELLEELEARGGESMAALQEMRHVVTRLTDTGLIIDIHDLPGEPLFHRVNDLPTARLETTLRVVARLLGLVANDVSVAVHVPALPVVAAERPIWEVTTDRALAARRALEQAGFDPDRVRRVTGHGDRSPIDDDPMAARNGRVEVTVLRDGV